jgi:hypothetical protein
MYLSIIIACPLMHVVLDPIRGVFCSGDKNVSGSGPPPPSPSPP